jgi:non-heme chloroperoxidase
MNRRTLQAAVLATGAAAAPAVAPAAGAAPPHARPAAIRTADGLSLAYEDWGAGPPVVLIHSWALQSAMWRQQIPPLTDAGFRAIAFDRRGHGRSGGNGRGYDIDTLADDLAAVMDQLDLKDATLVGHSMAGCEIARYLSRHGSGRVAKLVLLAPTMPYLVKATDNPLGLPQEGFDQMRQAWRTDFTKWIADNAAPFFTPATPQITREWAVGLLLDCPLSVALATNLAVTGVDFRPDLAKIATPTLVIHGDVDASAPLAITGEPTAKAIRGARLQVLKGAPHGLFLTHAEAVNRAIVDFART